MVDENKVGGLQQEGSSEGMTNSSSNVTTQSDESTSASSSTNPFYPKELKSDDFVLTSDVKLNFLACGPAPVVQLPRHTGAVPKRVILPSSANGLDQDEADHAAAPSPNGTSNHHHHSKDQETDDDGPTVGIQHHKSTSWEGHTLSRLQLENEQLHHEVELLQRKLQQHRRGTSSSTDTPIDSQSGGEDIDRQTSRIHELELELERMRELVATLRLERKRLKSEKLDLLSQMKQLYATLDDKERELRDFIRNYEQRMRESESSLQRLTTEREERERERWSLLRQEREISNVAAAGVAMATSAGVLATLPAGDRGSCSADSGVRGSSDRESAGGGNLSDSTTDGTPTLATEQLQLQQQQHYKKNDLDTISMTSSTNASSHLYQTVGTPKECSPSLSPLNASSFSRSLDVSSLSRSVEQLSSPVADEAPPQRSGSSSSSSRHQKTHYSRLTGRGGAWGSISRVFTRSRHRHKVSSPSSQEEAGEMTVVGAGGRSWSPLTEEGYAEKLRLLREAAAVPMERWRAPAVLAWLEIALGMPQYGARCAENVKSGKVLLELSDLELECGLGITHPMHRKKLRLAIEEHRHPSLVRYPCIGQLGHTWVAAEWLPDLGLAQYAESFAANLVDARMLDHLSKKELEKFLGVTRKFHQASIVHGIHLLRMMKFDRQALAVRRNQCESVDADPLVWTNQRFIKWARNIDLCEYADNLRDSGVHGALVVLEPSFNGDTMATALGIPPAKNIIRRHLAAELESLILPARYVIFCQMEEYQAEVARAVNNVKHIPRGAVSGACETIPSGSDFSSIRAAVRGRVEDWKAVWRGGVSRLGEFLPAGTSQFEENTVGNGSSRNWTTATLRKVLRARHRGSTVQPLPHDNLHSPTESIPGSITSELNFRASTPLPPDDDLNINKHQSERSKPRRTRSFADVRTKN